MAYLPSGHAGFIWDDVLLTADPRFANVAKQASRPAPRQSESKILPAKTRRSDLFHGLQFGAQDVDEGFDGEFNEQKRFGDEVIATGNH